MNVIWTEQALLRLGEIEDFIAQDNPAAAVALTDRIMSRAESLPAFPQRGRVVPEYGNPEIREVLEDHFRIVYSVCGAAIQVLTVFEGYRLLRDEDV